MEMTECILEAKFQRDKTCEEHRHGAVVAENKSSHMLLWEARACPWGGNSSRRARSCFSARWFPLQQHPKVRHTGDREWKILCNLNAQRKKCLKKKGQT